MGDVHPARTATGKGTGMTTKKNKLHVEVPPGETVIRMSREFDFPRDLVWKVSTSGEHMSKWWGPAKYKCIVHEFDFRNGGKWRIDQVDPDNGMIHPFRGEFSDIDAPNEFTWTFGYADFPPGTESYRYVDLGNGRCRVASVSYFPTVEARDAIAAGGMESGAIESYERLDALLAQLSKASK
jgi:uncharacterized protein YndB with AHSA1/START domain